MKRSSSTGSSGRNEKRPEQKGGRGLEGKERRGLMGHLTGSARNFGGEGEKKKGNKNSLPYSTENRAPKNTLGGGEKVKGKRGKKLPRERRRAMEFGMGKGRKRCSRNPIS